MADSRIFMKDGFELTTLDGVIVAIERDGRKLQVNDRVMALENDLLVGKGTPGVITVIHEPGEEFLTSDLIEVVFEGEVGSYFMKLKELEHVTPRVV